MKTGNPKQAAVLGVVAVLVVGFLIKTIISTFGGGSGAPPTGAEKSGRAETTASEARPMVGVMPAVAKVESIAAQQTAQTEAANELAQQIPTGFVERDVFSRPNRPKPKETDGDRLDGSDQGVTPLDPVKRDPSGDPLAPSGNLGLKPKDPGLPDPEDRLKSPDQPSGEPGKDEQGVQNEPRVLKFLGYIHVGSPVAVIEIAGVIYHTQTGDRPEPDVQVVLVSKHKISVRSHGKTISVPIGKQREL